MNQLKVLFAAGALAALAACTTTSDKENMLSAAGFKMVPADTPAKLANLNSLPPDKITTVEQNGTLYFIFPDAEKNMLFVGKEPQYQEYQKLCVQKQIIDHQLSAAEMSQNAWAEWGPWGGWDGR
jgi:hypothetical protein